RRNPALRQPALGQQPPQLRRIGLIGLRTPVAATGGGGAGRLADRRGDARGGQFPGGIPPPGAPFHRERDVVTVGESRQPRPPLPRPARLRARRRRSGPALAPGPVLVPCLWAAASGASRAPLPWPPGPRTAPPGPPRPAAICLRGPAWPAAEPVRSPAPARRPQ